jgi:hypothetical protein
VRLVSLAVLRSAVSQTVSQSLSHSGSRPAVGALCCCASADITGHCPPPHSHLRDVAAVGDVVDDVQRLAVQDGSYSTSSCPSRTWTRTCPAAGPPPTCGTRSGPTQQTRAGAPLPAALLAAVDQALTQGELVVDSLVCRLVAASEITAGDTVSRCFAGRVSFMDLCRLGTPSSARGDLRVWPPAGT